MKEFCMMSSNLPEACVQRINEITGLELTLDAEHAAQFDYLGRPVLLRFLEELSACVVHVQLEALEEPALPAALADLLEANFMFSDTSGGSLSWSQETRMVAMNFLLPLADTDAPRVTDRSGVLSAQEEEALEEISRITDRALTLLPEPDSPTMATHSPAWT